MCKFGFVQSEYLRTILNYRLQNVAGGGGSADIEEEKELSLFDLRSDDGIGSTNARKKVSSTSKTQYDTSTNSTAIEKKDSKPGEGSLMDLLDNDVIDFSVTITKGMNPLWTLVPE